MLVFVNLAHFSWNDHFQIPDFPTRHNFTYVYPRWSFATYAPFSGHPDGLCSLELWVVLRKLGYEASVVPHYGPLGAAPGVLQECGSSIFNFEKLHTDSHSGYKCTFPGSELITWGSDSSPSISLKRSSAPNFKIAVSSSLLKGLEL